MLSNYKIIFENKLARFARYFSWLNPNILTAFGLIPQILFVWFMANQSFGWALIMLLLTPLDMLDGILARNTNRVTKFGGFLDSTLDRVGDFLLIYGLYVGHLLEIELTLALILCSFLISYIRSRAELAARTGQSFNQGIIERPERLILIGITLFLWYLSKTQGFNLYFYADLSLLLLLVLSIITVLQRLWFAYKKLSY